ncbi:MAG TPA: hypothetical protein VFW40_05995, partial [Capsulimonadaceae bacterium]|nr:hypothetical protein [Capsulimonadaceae bacterium]
MAVTFLATRWLREIFALEGLAAGAGWLSATDGSSISPLGLLTGFNAGSPRAGAALARYWAKR